MASSSTVAKAAADDARNYWLAEGRTSVGGHIHKIDLAKERRGVDPMFAGIKIVDCDTHFTEPPDLWTANAPAGMKDKMPHVRRVNGSDQWFVGDKDFGSLGGNVIAKNGDKLLGKLSFENYDMIDPGSYLIKPRLEAMDAMGIWAHVCFQNGGVTQAGSLVALNDEPLAIAITQIYNDACANRMKESGGRIYGMGTLPYWDKKLMNAEMRRIIDLGVKGVVLPDRPERLSEGYLGNDGKVSHFWEEVFDLCSATGTPINFHINSSLDAYSAIWDNLDFVQRMSMSALIHEIGCAATMSNFILSGLLDKYPKLKIGLIESGAGWVPMWLEGLAHQFVEFRITDIHKLQKTPKEYFQDNFWVTFWYESFAITHMLEEIGVNKVMFETDYPHPTSLYPGVQDKLVQVLGNHDYEVRKRVLQQNAAELYNLDI